MHVHRCMQVMKLDVEGFELPVLQGAAALLQQHSVWHVMSEVNLGILGPGRARDYLRFLSMSGYAISPTSFKVRAGCMCVCMRVGVETPVMTSVWCLQRPNYAPPACPRVACPRARSSLTVTCRPAPRRC